MSNEQRYEITVKGVAPALAWNDARQTAEAAGGRIISERPQENRAIVDPSTIVTTIVIAFATSVGTEVARHAIQTIVDKLRNRGAQADSKETGGYL